MSLSAKLLLAGLCSGLLVSSLQAATMEEQPGAVVKGADESRQTDAFPYLDNRTHRYGKMWMTVSNRGTIGNSEPGSDEALSDPEYPGTWAPQCEFPGGSGVQYLYQGSIWIGALIVDEFNQETPRVSFGSEGWERNCCELWPGSTYDDAILETSTRENAISRVTGKPIYDSLAVSEQDYYAIFTDTLMALPTGYGWDEQDRNHIPLGVTIEQTSHSWSYNYAQDFIIIDYKITNTGSKFLKNLYVGLYVDSDVGNPRTEPNPPGCSSDDFCGFRKLAVDSVTNQQIEINAAYIADNDGRPVGVDTGSNLTNAHVTGTRVLRAPNPMLETTFNWWNSNGDVGDDYGPAWTACLNDPDGLWTATLGTPRSDANKYYVMSNGEFDPPMYMCVDDAVLPPQVVNGDSMEWQNPDGGVQGGGGDTRYLISWGPMGVFDYVDGQGVNVYRLNPGESFLMTLAYVAGENLHNRSHPQNDPGRIDSTLFDWTDFDFNAIWAKRVYDNEMFDTPIYDYGQDGIAGTNDSGEGDGVLDTGDGWPGEDVGLDMLWAPAVGDTVRYFGEILHAPNGDVAIYPGPDSLESNGLLDSGYSEYWGTEVSEDQFLWEFLYEIAGNREMREDSFLIYAGPKFSQGGVDDDDWYIGHFNNNEFLDSGDGIPDFQGPPPPPCPDMRVETGTDYVDLIWTRNSMSETYADPFSHVQDFEGYRIWVSNTQLDNEYTLLYDYDNVNYAYFDSDNALRTMPDPGPIEALDMRNTNNGWERQPVGNNTGFADIATAEGEPLEAIVFDSNANLWIDSGPGYNEQINAYVGPVAVRLEGGNYSFFLADGTELTWSGGSIDNPASGRLTYNNGSDDILVIGDRFMDDSTPDYVWTKGVNYNVEFRKRIENVKSLFPRYYAVSAYDFGDYQTGTEPLETAQGCNAVRQAPSGVPEREVKAVPNPYRADQNYHLYGYAPGNSADSLRWENQDDGSDTFWPQQDRRMEFINLPQQCLIRIYTVSGDLVQILPHNVDGDGNTSWAADYSEAWDLNSRNFQQVASGLYFFSVEDKTPGNEGDIYTGKFVIIK